MNISFTVIGVILVFHGLGMVMASTASLKSGTFLTTVAINKINTMAIQGFTYGTVGAFMATRDYSRLKELGGQADGGNAGGEQDEESGMINSPVINSSVEA